MNLAVKTFLTFGIILICCLVSAQGLKTSGKKMIDQNGNEVLLRGMGLGGWMIQEGYMMETSNFAGPQREIKAKIQELIGPDSTAKYYKTWHLNHCTKTDIDSLASWGFNSVRLPMHYNLFTFPIEDEPVAGTNTWLDEGFMLTDSLVKWCSARHIYVILDLHAAPGGQGRDASISDYDPSKPSLWESDANKQKTIALWRKLAERYANEPWVGGYDLINETNWNFTTGANQNGCDETSNAPLRQLLVDITNAIRQVDHVHTIFIEGNCWANNYNGILPAWDNNMVVSFHKYWNYNDQNSIQWMVNMRNTYNIPLWLGESGENSNPWFTEAIRLMERNDIGWSWWPLKKINTVVNPLTIPENPGYRVLLNYWQNGGSQPSAAFAMNALMQQAQNARNENCVYRKDVIDAMFRQVNDSSARPFANQVIPGIIHASDYDLGRNGIAYFDMDTANYSGNTGIYTSWNSGGAYRNDAVDIEASLDNDLNSNGFDVGWTQNNEWLQYTVDVDSSAAYTIRVRYASNVGIISKIRLVSSGTDITASTSFPATPGVQSWNYYTFNDVILYKGKQKIRIYIDKGGLNLGFISFSLSKQLSGMSLLPVSGETYTGNRQILLTFNKQLDPSTISKSGFNCIINGNAASISSAFINPINAFQVIFSLVPEMFDGDDIKASYSGGSVLSTDQTLLSSFSNLQVRNKLPVHFVIPGKIEAESFDVNQGLQVETTTDTGGGLDVGYTNAGDYLEYGIRVKKKASYTLDIRVACLSNAGTLEFQQLDSLGNVLGITDIDVPVTGGWQTWTTTSGIIQMKEGIGRLRVKIIKPEFNMNWYQFTEIVQDTTVTGNKGIRIYPNPVRSELKVEIPGSKGKQKSLAIHSMSGSLILKYDLASSQETYNLNTINMVAGFYIVELNIAGTKWHSKLTVL